MTEIEMLLERQARWQRRRKDLSWPEKIRMAEQIRSSTERWRASRESGAAAIRVPGRTRDLREP
jgi:hypothetical protein